MCLENFILNLKSIRDALRDLVPLVQFKKRKEYLWRSIPFIKL